MPYLKAVVGSFPVLVSGFMGPHASLPIRPQDNVLQPPYGWAHKALWAVSVHLKGKVVIHGHGLQGGPALHFSDEDTPNPVTTFVLDPRHPTTYNTGSNVWAYFPSDLWVPQAGCFELDARWPGGQWKGIFGSGLYHFTSHG